MKNLPRVSRNDRESKGAIQQWEKVWNMPSGAVDSAAVTGACADAIAPSIMRRAGGSGPGLDRTAGEHVERQPVVAAGGEQMRRGERYHGSVVGAEREQWGVV